MEPVSLCGCGKSSRGFLSGGVTREGDRSSVCPLSLNGWKRKSRARVQQQRLELTRETRGSGPQQLLTKEDAALGLATDESIALDSKLRGAKEYECFFIPLDSPPLAGPIK